MKDSKYILIFSLIIFCFSICFAEKNHQFVSSKSTTTFQPSGKTDSLSLKHFFIDSTSFSRDTLDKMVKVKLGWFYNIDTIYYKIKQVKKNKQKIECIVTGLKSEPESSGINSAPFIAILTIDPRNLKISVRKVIKSKKKIKAISMYKLDAS